MKEKKIFFFSGECEWQLVLVRQLQQKKKLPKSQSSGNDLHLPSQRSGEIFLVGSS